MHEPPKALECPWPLPHLSHLPSLQPQVNQLADSPAAASSQLSSYFSDLASGLTGLQRFLPYLGRSGGELAHQSLDPGFLIRSEAQTCHKGKEDSFQGLVTEYLSEARLERTVEAVACLLYDSTPILCVYPELGCCNRGN